MEFKPNKKFTVLLGYGIIVLLFSASFILTAWAGSDGQVEKEINLCNSCHQMDAEVLTWKESTHRNIACTKCHQSHSILGMFIKNRDDAQTVKSAKNFIKDDVCLSCHTMSRLVTPPETLIISHDVHMTKGVDCIDCHKNIAHAQIKLKLEKAGKKDINEVNIKDVKQIYAYGNRVPMSTCFECHNGVKAPDKCEACHKNKDMPETHKQNVWGSKHGITAFSDLASCNFCHEYDVVKQHTVEIKNGNYKTLQKYARGNEFCIDCHQNKPSGHNEIYYVAHNKSAKANKQYCLVCHNWEEKDFKNAPSDVLCTKCHVPSVHPIDWEKTHKNDFKDDKQATCFECHDQVSCTKCHSARGVNVAK